MTLSFHEIGLRFPDAVVYWDRDVAPTLDWEPRFVVRGEILWADDPECAERGHGRCRCLTWWHSQWCTVSHHGAWQTPLGAVTRVDDLVEDYRVRLGFRPWDEYASFARDVVRAHSRATGIPYDSNRRSGRTTLGLLRAIARCVLSGERELLIVGPDRAVTEHSVHRARDLLAGLGISGITVRSVGSRPRQGRVNYRDHYLDER